MEKAAVEHGIAGAGSRWGGSRRVQGLIAVNVTAALFGTVALYGKLDVSPYWIVAVRAAVASLALGLIGSLGGERVALPPRHLLPSILWTSGILALHWWAFFLSVQWAGVAVATLTFAVFPLFTVMIEALRNRRRPHLFEVMAGAAIVLAVSLLVEVRFAGPTQGLGALAGLASALGFSIFGIASKRLGKELSSVRISLLQNLVIAAAMLPFLPLVAGAPVRGSEWFWLVVLGVVSTALMHQLFFFSIQRLSVSTASAFIALEPVYAIVYAALLFGESLTVWVAISGVLIVGSSLVMLRLEGQGPAPDWT